MQRTATVRQFVLAQSAGVTVDIWSKACLKISARSDLNSLLVFVSINIEKVSQ